MLKKTRKILALMICFGIIQAGALAIADDESSGGATGGSTERYGKDRDRGEREDHEGRSRGGAMPSPTTSPKPSPTTSSSPSTIDGAALYNSKCAGCHGTSKRGSSASSIQSAINNNAGGMGSLKSLTSAQIQAISQY